MSPFTFANRPVAVAIATVAAGYLVLAFRLPDFSGVNVPVQPSTLPRWLGVVLLLLAVALFFQRSEQADGAAPSAGDDAQHHDALGAHTAQDAGPQSTRMTTTVARPPAPNTTRLGRTGKPELEVALFIAAMCGYVALFEPLGFVVSSAVYMAAVTWYLGYRRHVVSGFVSLGTPLILYLVVTEGLGVGLPNGPLPF
jgi:putative tricarboxylic transport membrane protein